MKWEIYCRAGLAMLVLLVLAGCEEPAGKQAGTPAQVAPPAVILEPRPNTPGFVLSSPAFNDGAAVPASFTCDGDGRSPELKWRGAPAGAKSYCLIATDPDAPGGTFTHWLRINIPGTASGLAAGSIDPGMDGHNDFGKVGYGGPCPPSGEHHYRFTLYALSCTAIGPSAGESRREVELAIKGSILGQTTLTGTYRKK